jgi:RNA polymerase sigma-70 factor (ECF subfamily)
VTSLATHRASSRSADADLVLRAARGDVEAFDTLLGARLDRCYRLAWSILDNDADAADATQEAFVAAWRQLPRLRDPDAFDGWLNRIVANAARMARRHRRRLREVPVLPAASQLDPGETSVSPVPSTTDAIEAVGEREAIGRAFDRLKPDERAILVLHHVEAQPVGTIARALGIPLGTAKWRLHAARRALERALEGER